MNLTNTSTIQQYHQEIETISISGTSTIKAEHIQKQNMGRKIINDQTIDTQTNAPQKVSQPTETNNMGADKYHNLTEKELP